MPDQKATKERSSTSFYVNRRDFLAQTGSLIAVPALSRALQAVGGLPQAFNTSLAKPPSQKRPQWWRDEGVVIAILPEPLLPILRNGGWDLADAFLDYNEKIAVWRRGYSEEVVLKLKDLGFNFLLLPFYKGGGIKAEQTSMQDTKNFTKVCHKHGLRVGCYLFSGTILYESMLEEDPDALNWFTVDKDGKYVPYGPMYFRRSVNRSHPGMRAHMRELVRFAVQEAQVDLIHFDNYNRGAPDHEPYAVQQFRRYVEEKYTPEDRRKRFGFSSMNFIEPPPSSPKPDLYNGDPLYQDFIDFRCEMLADTYRELSEFARSLNPDILMECNPGGYLGNLISGPDDMGAGDHTLLVPWGGAFWDEGSPIRLENGVLNSRFRSHMMGRQFSNMLFHYTSDRVSMAESMANNLQCLGCVTTFANGEILPIYSQYDSKKLDPAVLASIRFFRREQRHYQDADQVADVGVLNTYANTAYGPAATRESWQALTQALYQGKVPFTLVPGRYPGNLSRFRVLVLADLALISDELVNAVRNYVREGGGLVMTGAATQFDEHSYRRENAALADLFGEPLRDKPLTSTPGKGRASYVPRIVIPENFRVGVLPENRDELLNAVRWAAGGPLQAEVKAPETVTMSLYVQPNGHRLLHLVNYDEGHPISDIDVVLQQPSENPVVSVSLLSPDSGIPQTLSKAQRGRELHFTVPRLEVYGLVVII